MSGNEIAQSGARTVSWRHVVNKAIRPIGPDSQLPFFGSYHSQGRVVFASQISTLPLTLPLPFNFNLYLTFLQDNSRIREDNLLIYASFSDILIKGKCFPLLYLKVMLMDISYKKIMEATHVRGDTLSFSN